MPEVARIAIRELLVDGLFETFERAGRQLFLVGGAVRDLVMGASPEALTDLDFATDARPEQIAAILRRARLPVFEVGAAFGTVGTVLAGNGGPRRDVQVTTYRLKETYRRGSRHPEVVFGQFLDADLARRDFSMNAMALDRLGTVVDPHGGRADIAARRLRVVGDPFDILAEDPLRILRAARFIARFGFAPHPDLRAAATALAGSILEVSHERWLMEMNKLLEGRWVGAALEFLKETGVLKHILPEVDALAGLEPGAAHRHKDLWAHTRQVAAQAEARPAVRWAALLHDIGKARTRTVDEHGRVHFYGHEAAGAEMVEPIAQRFRFDRALRERVRFLVLHHQRPNAYLPEWTDAAIRRFGRDVGLYLEDLLALSRADITSKRAGVRAEGLKRVEELAARLRDLAEREGQGPLLPKGLGRAIMERFGLPEGPAVGALRTRLEQAVLDGLLPRNAEYAVYLEYLAWDDTPGNGK